MGHQADGAQLRFIVALQTQQSAQSWPLIGPYLTKLVSDWLMLVLHTWCQNQGGQLCLITRDTLVPLNFKIHIVTKNTFVN